MKELIKITSLSVITGATVAQATLETQDFVLSESIALFTESGLPVIVSEVRKVSGANYELVLKKSWPYADQVEAEGVLLPTTIDLREVTRQVSQQNEAFTGWFTKMDIWLNEMGTVEVQGPSGATLIKTLPELTYYVEQNADQVQADIALIGDAPTYAQNSKDEADRAAAKALEAKNSAIAAKNSELASATSEGNSADSAALSSAKASASSTSASKAKTSETNSADSEQKALAHKNKAHKWSQEAYGVQVETGEYSAYHWSVDSKNSANAAKDSETAAADSEQIASQKASEASDSESTATLKAGESADRAAAASNSESLAEQHKLKAKEWSEKDVDIEVETGLYSSRHHATKSAGSAAEALQSEQAAGQHKSDASGFMSQAQSHMNKAMQWAEEADGVEVEDGKYSSKHWAGVSKGHSEEAKQAAQALTGGMYMGGQWDASTGQVPPTPDVGSVFYKIVNSGTILGIEYAPGDSIIYNPQNSEWFKQDGSDKVDSVNGHVGSVNLTYSDVNALPDTWTPSWSQVKNKPATATRWPTLSEIGAKSEGWTPSWSEVTNKPDISLRNSQSKTCNTGWHTIASNSGNRASAKFVIYERKSGSHQAVHFYAAHHYGKGNSITVHSNSSYGNNGALKHIRLLSGGTYDGALLQVYVDRDATSECTVVMYENDQSTGWVLEDWLTTAPISGLSEAARVELDKTMSINTTSPIYERGYQVYSTGHKPSWNEVTSKPNTFTPSAHNHSAANITSGTLSSARLPTITASMVNFANQSLNTNSSPSFLRQTLGGDGVVLDIDGSINGLSSANAWIKFSSVTYGWLVGYQGVTSGEGGNEFAVKSTFSDKGFQIDHQGNFQLLGSTIHGNGSGLTGTASLRATGTTKSDVGLSNVPNVNSRNASNLNSGTLSRSRLPTITTSNVNFANQSLNTSSRPVFNGLRSNGDIDIIKDNAWLTLESSSSGANGGEQGAGISIGEGGKKGSAVLHLTYTGDGRGHIGMGTVGTNGIPANEALELYYTSKVADFKATPTVNGSQVYHEGHKPTKSEVGLGNVPNVNTTNAGNITSGTLSSSRLPTITTSNVNFANQSLNTNSSPTFSNLTINLGYNERFEFTNSHPTLKAETTGGWAREYRIEGTETANATFGAYGSGASVNYVYIAQSDSANSTYSSSNALRIYDTYPAWGTNKLYHEGYKPTKSDVGLGSVGNYSRAYYDGRYLNESSNLADLPNKSSARSNLGLSSGATTSVSSIRSGTTKSDVGLSKIPNLTVTDSADSNTIMRRNSSGDTWARLFRSSYSSTNSSIAAIYTTKSIGGDYMRPSTPAQVKSALRISKSDVGLSRVRNVSCYSKSESNSRYGYKNPPERGVGAYLLAQTIWISGKEYKEGQKISGSKLNPSSTGSSINKSNLTGTWKCMGYANADWDEVARTTLFLRIA